MYMQRREREYTGHRAMPGMRKRGRPQRRFMHVVKEDLQKSLSVFVCIHIQHALQKT